MLAFLRTKSLIELQSLQTEATSAYQRLITGRAPRVVVDQNGERVEFTAIKSSDLASYLNEIAAAIQGLQGQRAVLTRPLGFIF